MRFEIWHKRTVMQTVWRQLRTDIQTNETESLEITHTLAGDGLSARAPRPPDEEEIVFSTNTAGKAETHVQRDETELSP